LAKTPTSRTGKLIRDHALSYPETTETFPWGEHAFKVRGKTFPSSRLTVAAIREFVEESYRAVAPKRVLASLDKQMRT
jgi:predicted DNA-binding protein (MmcQ/YjbR family)